MPERPFQPAAPGEPVRVADGLLWVRLPLPFPPEHVDVYLLDDGEERVLVDCGHADEASRELLVRLLARDGRARPLDRLVVTHFHPDHVGNAGHLCGHFEAELWMARVEWAYARMLAFEPDEAWNATLARYDRLLGVDPRISRRRLEEGNVYARRVAPPPGTVRVLADGEEVGLAGRCWRVAFGAGHSPAQLTLYDRTRRILICADQILPDITPVVGCWPQEPESDPLGAYLASLERFAGYPEDVLVLPGHGGPFRGLRQRVAELRRYHEERLARALDLCRMPTTAFDVAVALFDRPLDGHTVALALAEGLAHLNHLVARGEVERERAEDGTWRFRRK